MSADVGLAGTLPQLLELRAQHPGDATALNFGGKTHSFAQLWQGTRRFARALVGLGLDRGHRVLIVLPNGPGFFHAFYGTQLAGAVPVPIFPGSGPDRILKFAGLSGASVIVFPRELGEGWAGSVGTAGEASPRVVCIEDIEGLEPLSPYRFPDPGDLAFIQYTSGSTGEPKGVMLSHQNVLTNVRQLIAATDAVADDIFVSWLPAYHDMGLILMAICPLYLGARLCLLPAELGSIRSWLATIESQRGTFTAAPDFAYRLCVREASHSNRVDLSSLRVALNAAEPVRATTADAFETAFGLNNVMISGYGLAEATVGVSISRPGRSLRTDGRGLVSVGRPFAGLDVEIVDDGAAQPAGQIGEIAIRGPCNTRGYLNDPAATRGLQWRDGFILTGDYGYLDDAGELFIAGRKKNVIKHAGTTVAPQEIEETVDRLPFVRYSAAVGVDRGGFGGEQVYIFAETRGLTNDAAGAHEAALEVVRAMHACMGFRPGRTYLLRPRTIPRTSNGKVQHALLRERYLDGSLRASGAILYPEY